MTSICRIAIAGAGLIGRKHAELIRGGIAGVELAAIVDPAPGARDYAHTIGVSYYPTLSELFSRRAHPDGIILATPNQLHVENGLECVDAGCAILVEKPIARTSEEARILVDAANTRKVPILVGHHRRHNPIIQKAKALIQDGQLGDIKLVNGTFWIKKPDNGYFDPAWRRTRGAGPIMVNSVHDMDLLRYLCGEVASVHAVSSNTTRQFEVEDTAVALLMFRSGALGTFSLSDTVEAPWSWEMTSGENADYTNTRQNCYMIGGTRGAMSVPDLRVWRYGDNWNGPVTSTPTHTKNADPLVAQIQHFARVIEHDEAPVVSGEEGIKSLAVVEAILKSAETGQTVHLDP